MVLVCVVKCAARALALLHGALATHARETGVAPDTAAGYFSAVQGWHLTEYGVKLVAGGDAHSFIWPTVVPDVDDGYRQKMRDQVLDTTSGDFAAFADVLDEIKAKGRVAVLGGAEAVAEADVERDVRLLFGGAFGSCTDEEITTKAAARLMREEYNTTKPKTMNFATFLRLSTERDVARANPSRARAQ